MVTTTDSLVKDVLASMQAQGRGDPTALDELRGFSNKDGAATEVATPVAPVADALVADKLEITRPNGQVYYVRKLGKHHDVQVVRQARAKGINPLLTGPPGTGKTALVEAAFADEKVYTVQGSGDTEVADFIGGYVQVIDPATKTVTYELVLGPLPLAMQEGRTLYVDEIALIDPKVLAILYASMDGRRELRLTQFPELPPIQLKPGFFVIAATNPNAPGARMSEALLSRFNLQFEVTTDYTLARKMGADPKIITAAQNMQRKVEAGAMGWAPQLRELLAFKQISDEFGEEIALRNMVTSAPEMDRSQVADLISRSYHTTVKGLKTT